jgi:uncharacterized protein YjbJ (UPF0337 family)
MRFAKSEIAQCNPGRAVFRGRRDFQEQKRELPRGTANAKGEFRCGSCRRRKIDAPKHMNTLQMKGSWNVAKGKLKQKYAELTDDDLQYVEGKEAELIGRIQKRTGRAKEEIEKAVDEGCNCEN